MAETKWRLVAKDGRLVLPLWPQSSVLGRDKDCTIRLQDSSVSRHHVRFTAGSDELIIADLQSRNGTLVNGKPVGTARVPRDAGATTLQVGKMEFIVIHDSSEEWYYKSGEQTAGPLTEAQLVAAADRGELRPEDQVWIEGMEAPVAASEVEGLFPDRPAGVVEEPARADALGLFQREGPGHGTVICPYCWHRFEPEDVLFIACHPDLLGDPVLGPEEPRRFMPSRFTSDGMALDAGGVICPDMACPKCHMRLPSVVLAHPPLFVSVVGAPASGKSYFLASMTWRLRTTLSQNFSIHFTDVDAVTNQWINSYEEKLFLQGNDTEFQAIAKTQNQGNLYQQVTISGMNVFLPKPSMFSVAVDESGPSHGLAMDRTLVLYDNAGEHYHPGGDTALDPGTQHLAFAEGLVFLFDPTKDPRFRKMIRKDDPQLRQQHLVQRQDVLLTEMINRIRRRLGLSAKQHFDRTLVVAVSKADLLEDHFDLSSDPWHRDPESHSCVLDLTAIANMSFLTRDLLLRHVPEVVNAVEAFAENVVYMPISALGHSPTDFNNEGRTFVVRPCDVRPMWIDVPAVYILHRLGYVRGERTDVAGTVVAPSGYEVSGRHILLSVPGIAERLRIPVNYGGHVLRCPQSQIAFRVPEVVGATAI